MKKSPFCHNTALFAWKFQICFSIYFFTLDPLWWFRFFFQTTLILDFIEENSALSCKNGTFFPSFSSLNISNKLTFGILCPSSELHFTHSREREREEKNSCHRCLPRWNLSWALARRSKDFPQGPRASWPTYGHRQQSYNASSRRKFIRDLFQLLRVGPILSYLTDWMHILWCLLAYFS